MKLFAVMENDSVIKLTSCIEEAMEILVENNDRSVYQVTDLDSLKEKLNKKSDKNKKRCISDSEQYLESLSDAANTLFDKLDKMDLCENASELKNLIKENSEKAVTEVRSLGIKSMKAVGDGFIAIGDLLKKAEQENCDLHTDDELDK